MADFFLLQSQKNDVFNVVTRHGFDRDEFEWVKVGDAHRISYVGESLLHKPSSGFWSPGREATGGYSGANKRYRRVVRYQPGQETTIQEEAIKDTWSDHLSTVNDWLRALRREVEAPDMWAAVRDGILAYDSSPDTPFDAAEQQALIEKLDQIERRFAEELSSHRKYVEEQFAELRQEVKSGQKRTGWRHRFNGLIIQLAMKAGQEAADLNKTKKLWDFAQQTIATATAKLGEWQDAAQNLLE